MHTTNELTRYCIWVQNATNTSLSGDDDPYLISLVQRIRDYKEGASPEAPSLTQPRAFAICPDYEENYYEAV